ncbi:MAG: hypothetical protein Q9221_002300 [Calogaya cf. arnoldii]
MVRRKPITKVLNGQTRSPRIKIYDVLEQSGLRRKREDTTMPVYPDKNTRSSIQAIIDQAFLYQQHDSDDQFSRKISIPLDLTLCMIHACSLQVTMQLQDVSEARKLYDQLIPLAPIMLALTAATTIWNGVLADTDVRWNLTTACLDDRTVDEIKGPNKKSRSRGSPNNLYISQDTRLLGQYHDTPIDSDNGVTQQLLDGGMDHRFAKHFAYLFAQDPLVVDSKNVETDMPESTALFEAVQSTNYPCVRFKPPPSLNSDIGWRVEFRPMEVQMTSFENAAFAIFIMLLSRTILHFDLNCYMPISMVDENMEKAHERDAANEQRFYFRANPLEGSKLHSTVSNDSPEVPTTGHEMVVPVVESAPESISSDDTENSSAAAAVSNTTSLSNSSSDLVAPSHHPTTSKRTAGDAELPEDRTAKSLSRPSPTLNPDFTSNEKSEGEFPQQSISALINGNPQTNFPGFIPLIIRYLNSTNTLSLSARAKIDEYLALISARATGKAWTASKWQREFVRGHNEYRNDSIVGEGVMYDLLKAVRGMEEKGLEGKMFDF